MSKVVALQLHTLAMSDSRIDHYLNLAAKGGASVVVLGEYVINSFFNDIIKMPKSMIKQQSEQKRVSLSMMASKYNLINAKTHHAKAIFFRVKLSLIPVRIIN